MSDGAPSAAPGHQGPRLVGGALVVLFAVLALAGPVKVLLRDDDGPGDGRVGMAGLRFSPSRLTVGVGTEVLFLNDDVAPHTVTAEDGSVDSGVIPPGGSFTLAVNAPFDYVCTIHPDMQGAIELEG